MTQIRYTSVTSAAETGNRPPRNTEAAPSATPMNPIWLSNVSRAWENVLYMGKKLQFHARETIPPTQNGYRGIYYLKHGKVRLFHMDHNERDITLYHMGEGSLLYDVTLLTATPPDLVVYSITPVEVYFFKSDGILTEEFTAKYPRLILSLIQGQAAKNMYYVRRLVNVAGGNAFSNTCKLMLDLSRSHDNAMDIPLGVTHEEIASILCVRRSWLGKILRRLKDEGVIARCTKSRLVISDMEKLAAYAV